MDFALISVLTGVGSVLLAYAIVRRVLGHDTTQQRWDCWSAAARAAGLTSIVRVREALEGRAADLHVRLSQFNGPDLAGARIEIRGETLPGELRVQRGSPGQRDVQIGDQGFDDAMWVKGPPALARALLDPQTRRTLRALADGRLERPGDAPFWATGRFDRGMLVVDVGDLSTWRQSEGFRDPAGENLQRRPDGCAYFGATLHLPQALSLVLALAHRLETPRDIARRLADNLTGEPLAEARLLLLNTLLEEFPQDAATRDAVVTAAADPDARLRLRAGALLGAQGRRVLLDLAHGEGADDDLNARAVEALGADVSCDELRGVLKNALLVRKRATASACLGALGRLGGAEAIATLAKVLAVERGELAARAALALGQTGDPAAQAPLLRALSQAGPDTRVAAATALGEAGNAEAVVALKQAEAAGDPALRRAARQAVARIQSRLPGASPGQLSLAAGERGQLTISEADEAGRLSLPSPEASTERGISWTRR